MAGNGAMAIDKVSRLDPKGAKGVVSFAQPFAVAVRIIGTTPMLLHRYDCEAVETKGKAKKGSAEKKSDNVESYVYRNKAGEIVIPGTYLKSACVESARFAQDPRSPRKSARDLFRAGIRVAGEASLGKKTWDYLDARRVRVNNAAITRMRPAFAEGWILDFTIEVLLPEYIGFDLLNEVVVRAGRTIGLADFRPDFGTFMVSKFEMLQQ